MIKFTTFFSLVLITMLSNMAYAVNYFQAHCPPIADIKIVGNHYEASRPEGKWKSKDHSPELMKGQIAIFIEGFARGPYGGPYETSFSVPKIDDEAHLQCFYMTAHGTPFSLSPTFKGTANLSQDAWTSKFVRLHDEEKYNQYSCQGTKDPMLCKMTMYTWE